LYDEVTVARTSSPLASDLAALLNVLLQVGSSLPVLPVFGFLQLGKVLQEFFWRDIRVRGHGCSTAERQQNRRDQDQDQRPDEHNRSLEESSWDVGIQSSPLAHAATTGVVEVCSLRLRARLVPWIFWIPTGLPGSRKDCHSEGLHDVVGGVYRGNLNDGVSSCMLVNACVGAERLLRATNFSHL
jgi:hypothetical protein